VIFVDKKKSAVGRKTGIRAKGNGQIKDDLVPINRPEENTFVGKKAFRVSDLVFSVLP